MPTKQESLTNFYEHIYKYVTTTNRLTYEIKQGKYTLSQRKALTEQEAVYQTDKLNTNIEKLKQTSISFIQGFNTNFANQLYLFEETPDLIKKRDAFLSLKANKDKSKKACIELNKEKKEVLNRLLYIKKINKNVYNAQLKALKKRVELIEEEWLSSVVMSSYENIYFELLSKKEPK